MQVEFNKNGILLEDPTIQVAKYLFAISLVNRKYWIPFNKTNLLKLSGISSLAKTYLDRYQKINLSSFDKSKYPYLRDYQYNDICKLINMKNHVNFSEMRCGKTVTTLVWIQETKLLKWIVVAPKSVIVLTWEQEIKKWFPNCKVYKAYSYTRNISKDKRNKIYKDFINEKEVAILLVSKDTIKQDIYYSGLNPNVIKLLENQLSTFGLVMDEATFLKNYKTKQSICLKILSRFATHTSCLTGTPTPKHPINIFAIMNIIEPSIFRSYYNIAEYFFGTDIWGSVENSFKNDELKQQWTEWLSEFGVRHTQLEVMKWLPKIERVDVLVNLEKEQLEHYNLMENQYMLSDNTRISNILSQYMYLKIISNSPYGTKKDYVLNYLENTNEEVIMLVSQFSDKVLKPLAEIFKKNKILYAILTGETNLQDRVNIINGVNNKQYKILLANRVCIKEGVKLPGVDTLIWFDKGSLADNQQVESRFLPTTEAEVVNSKKIISLITTDTIDKSAENQLLISSELNSYLDNFGKNS